MTQNIGPISAESHGSTPYSNNSGYSPFPSAAHSETNEDDRSQVDKERIRNLRSLLRTAEADKQQMRLEFDRERERYEKTLDSKDKAMENQLNMIQNILRHDHGRIVEMEIENQTESPEEPVESSVNDIIARQRRSDDSSWSFQILTSWLGL